jgi:hypothetical protein
MMIPHGFALDWFKPLTALIRHQIDAGGGFCKLLQNYNGQRPVAWDGRSKAVNLRLR